MFKTSSMKPIGYSVVIILTSIPSGMVSTRSSRRVVITWTKLPQMVELSQETSLPTELCQERFISLLLEQSIEVQHLKKRHLRKPATHTLRFMKAFILQDKVATPMNKWQGLHIR